MRMRAERCRITILIHALWTGLVTSGAELARKMSTRASSACYALTVRCIECMIESASDKEHSSTLEKAKSFNVRVNAWIQLQG